MRLIVTADLHYDIARSREPARRIAENICGLPADALLVLGDIAGRDAGIVRDGLRLFDSFAGRKLFVAGNHDIWTNPDECSLQRFEETLPGLCRETGFHPLDLEPLIIEDVGFVGSMGWYDFSFRPAWLNIPLRFYQEKVAPGAAAHYTRYRHLLADTSDVPPEAMGIGTRWMDGEHVRLPMSDVDFCRRLLARLSTHLDELEARCACIVAGFHHLPFSALVPPSDRPGWAFGSAFLGSDAFGEAILARPQVRYAYCGHSHSPGRISVQHIQCINVGCTYTEKRYEQLDIDPRRESATVSMPAVSASHA